MNRPLALVIGLGAAAAAGCSELHGTTPLAVPQLHAIARDAVMPVASSEIEFSVDGRRVPGTVVRPQAGGTYPAVVLLAGSGPTDRDWSSPMLATHNGSGKLLAEELASRGAIVLRFDKAASGNNPGPPRPRVTIDTFRDEVVAAVGWLRARPDVRSDRVFLAGHSEGGIHATRAATVIEPPVAGIIYLATLAHSMADVLVLQIEGNLRNPALRLDDAAIRGELATVRAALADLIAGRPVDAIAASTLPRLQQLVAGLAKPTTIQLTRQLLGFDHAAAAARLAMPVLVIGGAKDVQVDPERDGRSLADALRIGNRDVAFAIARDADHMLKHESRSLAELRADLVAVQYGYNAIDRTLDRELVVAVVDWLALHTKVTR